MNANNSYDEKELDDFMDNITKEDVEVPDELHDQIIERIDSLSRNRKVVKRVLIACFSLILLFVTTIRLNSDFASYASKIEFLKPLVELIRGVDSGIQNAYDNGYPMIPSVTHEEDGFIITVDKIFLDQERCRLTVTIKGEEIKDILEDKENVGVYLNGWGYSTNLREGYSNSDKNFLKGDFEFTFRDLNGFHWKLRGYDQKGMDIRIWVTINEKTGEHLLQKGELIHKFSMIEIPVDESQILESKVFKQEESMDFDHADLHISKFVISPTKMKVDIRVQRKMGSYIKYLSEFYIKDNRGNIYRPEGTASISSINKRGCLTQSKLTLCALYIF